MLLVILAWILGHNILYTYIVPLLAAAGMAGEVGQVLMTFGLASLAGIVLVGLGVDRRLRGLVLFSLAGFALATLALGHLQGSAWLVHASVALWGLTYGGAPTLLQTACADAAGEGGDVAQSMLVTVWNSAIALGGIVGGLLLTGAGLARLARWCWCWLQWHGCWPSVGGERGLSRVQGRQKPLAGEHRRRRCQPPHRLVRRQGRRLQAMHRRARLGGRIPIEHDDQRFTRCNCNRVLS